MYSNSKIKKIINVGTEVKADVDTLKTQMAEVKQAIISINNKIAAAQTKLTDHENRISEIEYILNIGD